MTTALRKYLILNLDPRSPSTLEGSHSAHHIYRIAKPGIRISEDRQCNYIADRRDLIRQFCQGHEADIGYTERHVGHAGAGHIDGFEAEILDDPREQGIRRTRENGRTLACEQSL